MRIADPSLVPPCRCEILTPDAAPESAVFRCQDKKEVEVRLRLSQFNYCNVKPFLRELKRFEFGGRQVLYISSAGASLTKSIAAKHLKRHVTQGERLLKQALVTVNKLDR